MIVTPRTALLLHMGAAIAFALGLWAWDAHGAAVWGPGAFSFCF